MTKTRQQEAEELDARAAAGETVVEGGTGGKSLQSQKNLAEGKQAHPSLISLNSKQLDKHLASDFVLRGFKCETGFSFF